MSVPEDPAPSTFVRRELDIDDEPPSGEVRGAASTTWLILAAGLALSLLLFKFGIWFFFLPIVIPFGLGGRSLGGRLAPRRRTVRLAGGVLSLETRSAFGSSRAAAIDVRGGVSTSVLEIGVDAHGRRQAVVRFASSAGAFDVRCADVARAHELQRQVGTMLAEGGIHVDRE
jgi:hypothetical protein